MSVTREWQLQEAKGRLSQLVRDADDAPQTITLRGRPTAVVIGFEEYRRLMEPQRSLIDVMRGAPGGFDDIFLARDNDATERAMGL